MHPKNGLLFAGIFLVVMIFAWAISRSRQQKPTDQGKTTPDRDNPPKS